MAVGAIWEAKESHEQTAEEFRLARYRCFSHQRYCWPRARKGHFVSCCCREGEERCLQQCIPWNNPNSTLGKIHCSVARQCCWSASALGQHRLRFAGWG